VKSPLLDKFSGAIVALIVSAFAGTIAMIINQDKELVLIQYRLEQVEKKLEKIDEENE
jgi:hypothetical protein